MTDVAGWDATGSDAAGSDARSGGAEFDPAGPHGAGSDAGRVPAHLADAAATLFGDRLPLAEAYAQMLATDGVIRGLIGPREAPRMWDRHLLNCAAVAELIPSRARIVDVGSGAGLPGLVLALTRPDTSVDLVEPLARRVAFLCEAVGQLGLEESVTVIRARAEDVAAQPPPGFRPADIVTARAVASLDRLAAWCLPLARVGGRLLALKGASAADEVVDHREAVRRAGGAPPVVRRCGVAVIDPPATVVEVVRQGAVAGATRQGGRHAKPRSRR